MFNLGRADVFGPRRSGLARAVRMLFDLEAGPTAETAGAQGAGWSPRGGRLRADCCSLTTRIAKDRMELT